VDSRCAADYPYWKLAGIRRKAVSSELGRLEKPPADQYKAERKIYLVPLVFGPRQPSAEFAAMYGRFWSGAREHLLKLEQSMGPIARVYHEGIGLSGEEGLALVEELNDKSASIARGKVEAGATFEALEDQELVAESLDWQRCLMVGLESRKAMEYVWSAHTEAMKKRYETMAQRIAISLQEEEAGLLFISEDHRLQFPPDARVFYVSPPALDEIHRWLRDQRTRSVGQGAHEEDVE
jgi:hypothetical protein